MVPALPPKKLQESQDSRTLAKRLCSSVVSISFCPEPVVHTLPEVMSFYPSQVVDQLKGAGIEPVATEIAGRALPFVGRL